MPARSKFKFALAGNYFTKWPISSKEIQESVGNKLKSIENLLVKGVNRVTELLEKNELAFVVICHVKRFSVMLQHIPYLCNRNSTLCIAFTDYCTCLQCEVVALEKSKLDSTCIGKEIFTTISNNVTPATSPMILSSDIKYTPVELVAKIRGDYLPKI